MNSVKKKKGISVLVSGASISGLSVAHWLAHYGFKVTIVEIAPYLRLGGQAVDIRGPGLEVAESMGILADLKKESTHLNGVSMVDANGKETYRSTERTLTRGRHDSPDIEILRDDLCRALHKTVGHRAEYIFDDSIASLKQDESGVDVTFTKAAPRRFDLVVGADGLRSNVRKLVFGPDEKFIYNLGLYIGVFTVPNFLGLDHWEVFHQNGDQFGVGYLIVEKESQARIYAGFTTKEDIKFDHLDIESQKQLLADRAAESGWEIPRIMKYMWDSPYFHFDSSSQVRMQSWSQGRVVLLGDAGYSISVSTGQGTTVSMVGAYVLAGELAANKQDLLAGMRSYENEMRDYVTRNQEQAKAPDTELNADDIPDFGTKIISMNLKDYNKLDKR